MVGQRFGQLVVIEYYGKKGKRHKKHYLCRCDCGNEIEVSYNNLKYENTKSCGCWHEKHLETGSRLYKCWQDMKSRCEYAKDFNYHNYGGRGIKVCDEWCNSYLSFRAWALNNGYTPTLTIDRIDVNGNYEPTNCRWVTLEAQQNNRRNNIYVEYNGETLTLRQLAKKYSEPNGISYKTLWYRFTIAKWDLERCVTIPLTKK